MDSDWSSSFSHSGNGTMASLLHPPEPSGLIRAVSDEWHTIQELTTGNGLEDSANGSLRNSASVSVALSGTPKDVIRLEFGLGGAETESIAADSKVTAAEALSAVLEKRGLKMEEVSIWLTNSKTPLPPPALKCSSFALGGQKLTIKAREKTSMAEGKNGTGPRRKMSLDNGLLSPHQQNGVVSQAVTMSEKRSSIPNPSQPSGRKASFAVGYSLPLPPFIFFIFRSQESSFHSYRPPRRRRNSASCLAGIVSFE